MTDEQIRTLWKSKGGSFHGPIVETATIPEERLFEIFREHVVLLEAAKKTLKENLHLCDGDVCTLYDLKVAVKAIDPEWDLFDGDERE